MDGGGGGYDIAVLLEEARPSPPPSPSEWMVSCGRQDEGKDSLGFFPLSEFCALSPPEQSGKGTSESFLRPEIHYGLFTSGKVGVGYNLF